MELFSCRGLSIQILLLIYTLSSAQGQDCPQPGTIAPCFCTGAFEYITCEGPEVTQEVINRMFFSLRLTNNVQEGEWLEIYFPFRIQYTSIEILDITPLYFSRFKDLEIHFNGALHSIVALNVTGLEAGRPAVDRLDLSANDLTDEGIDLHLFYPSATSLNLAGNRFEGGQYDIGDGSGHVEFLRGLSAFTLVKDLSFTSNVIRTIGGGQFRRNNHLQTIDFANTKLEEIAEDALLQDPLDETEVFGGRRIYLYGNPLSDATVHPNHGMESWQGEVEVFLSSCQFEYLTEGTWKNFLLANNHTNSYDFRNNPFFCNDRMRWLKEGRDDFEARVNAVNCENDPGKTIFNTEIELVKPDLVCPHSSQISPCTCSEVSTTVSCAGPLVTQQTVNSLFDSIRASNSLSSSDILKVFSFTLQNTDLDTLDLTPLLYSRIDEISIQKNSHLHTIDASLSSGGQIEALRINLASNNLTTDGINLLIFTSNVTELNLESNRIDGGKYEIEDGTGDIELLRGLGFLTNLQRLLLSFNKIGSLGGGQFRRNNRLRFINLGYNGLGEIGENAFVLNPLTNGEVISRQIFMHNNGRLSAETVHANHGLDSWEGQLDINFQWCSGFVFLSQDVWEKYLWANNHTNELDFSYIQSFVCDSRMKWLKDGRDDYQDRVYSVTCSNDPGHTIFTTDLV